ncbi:hypothetical protein GQ55_9G359300 [Panicum hallii var. hallii]|uniref:Uncharacterized protein n=1 Tax=Panicum hallii var. hallii TaxID=1504633 RepID=A0A2T7C8S1_9POAL|nr:hypothetical protein GQ55_9G359300 [Panicum hallii var. hallii]
MLQNIVKVFTTGLSVWPAVKALLINLPRALPRGKIPPRVGLKKNPPRVTCGLRRASVTCGLPRVTQCPSTARPPSGLRAPPPHRRRPRLSDWEPSLPRRPSSGPCAPPPPRLPVASPTRLSDPSPPRPRLPDASPTRLSEPPGHGRSGPRAPEAPGLPRAFNTPPPTRVCRARPPVTHSSPPSTPATPSCPSPPGDADSDAAWCRSSSPPRTPSARQIASARYLRH